MLSDKNCLQGLLQDVINFRQEMFFFRVVMEDKN